MAQPRQPVDRDERAESALVLVRRAARGHSLALVRDEVELQLREEGDAVVVEGGQGVWGGLEDIPIIILYYINIILY